MNKEAYNRIISKAYENLAETVEKNRPEGYTRKVMSKEEFEKEIRFHDEFNERWGLDVKKQDLTIDERMHYWFETSKPNRDVCDYVDNLEIAKKKKELDDRGIPTRLITVTYNNETAEIYES